MKNKLLFYIILFLMTGFWSSSLNAQSSNSTNTWTGIEFLGYNNVNVTTLNFKLKDAGSVLQQYMQMDGSTNYGYLGIGLNYTPLTLLDIKPPGLNLAYGINGKCVLQNWGIANIFTGEGTGLNLTTGFSNAFHGFDAGFSTNG